MEFFGEDRLTRRTALGLACGGALTLAGCATPDPLDSALPDMGSFRLGYNIAVTKNAKKIPPSRDATGEEWETALTDEIGRRFGGYDGAKEFHIALNLDGYSLAPPGIPIVLSPKSVLIVSANVWSAELGRKLHEKPEQITTFEGADTLLLGSGLIKDKAAQMQTLSRNMAAEVQTWMLTNPDWFDLPA
ncbi:MAG: hypothetical protein AAF919_18620 [Pseudomonadota bacterium]